VTPENAFADHLRLALAQVEKSVISECLMAAITYKEIVVRLWIRYGVTYD